MAANISLFPVITDDLLSKTRFQASPYQLYYVRDDQEYVLRTEEVDSSTIVHKVIPTVGLSTAIFPWRSAKAGRSWKTCIKR